MVPPAQGSNQHGPGARERAFEELFRRPVASSGRQPSQHPPPSSSSSTQHHFQYRYQQQQQQPQQPNYYPQHAYPDYPQVHTGYGQFGLTATPGGAGGGGGAGAVPSTSASLSSAQQHQQPQGYSTLPNRNSLSSHASYRSSNDSGTGSLGNQRPTSYFDQTYPGSSGAGAYAASSKQQQQLAYAAAQQQQQHRSYSSAQAYADYGAYPQGYYPQDDPAPPPPPPGARSQYSSPQTRYAPTMSSGPASASTSNSNSQSGSTSLFSRPSTSSVSSLPYSYDTTSNGSDSPASSFSPVQGQLPLPGAGAAGGYVVPPRLPADIVPTTQADDFFGNWQSEGAGYSDQSWRSSLAGGQTPTAGTYSKRSSPAGAVVEVDGYDGASMHNYPSADSSIYTNNSSVAYDRSRRSSADSDLRSVYQQASQPTTLLPINASQVSLQHYPYPNGGNGGGYAARSSSTLPLNSRRSSESVRVMSTQGYSTIGQDRALSFSSVERPNLPYAPYSSASAFAASQPHLPTHRQSGGSLAPAALTSHPSSTPASGAVVSKQRSPVVYPALLSRVAAAFRDRIPLSERLKDGLVYQEAFDGRDAVDKIAYIIKTSDRNLALLLGRALDAQKFFHDVTYDHRLRDSPNEIYQFRERIAASLPFLDDLSLSDPTNPLLLPPTDPSSLAQTPHAPHSAAARVEAAARGPPASPLTPAQQAALSAAAAEEDELPSGVFTLLTDCYSPTCTRDRLCYSIACPRRLEQQARLNLKREGLNSGLESVGAGGAGGLKRSNSVESVVGDLREPGSLWMHTVPQEIVDATSDMEKKRQEAINEVFYTERDFVRDMEYLRDSWIKPLRSSNIIPEARREDFVQQVFWNVLEIYAVNVRLSELLNKRQKQAHVVDHIGDIFLDMVPHFGPFVKYGAHQLYGKYEFEKEKGSNPAFAKFVDETERLPESRKLELNGYLTKPTTRLARYPLLLEAVLKQTSDDNPDKVAIPKVVKLVREFLTKVNIETGKSENRFNLAQLDQQLVFKNGEAVDLRLRDEERELIYKGPLKKRGGTQSESAELQVYLFDHAILMVKQKSKNEQYKVYRKPIPLELLVVAPVDDAATLRGGVVRPKSLMARGSSTAKLLPSSTASSQPPPGVDKNNKQGFALTFIHLGRRGYQITLWASTWTGRKKWLEKIEERQNELRERSLVFETLPLSAGYFVGTNRLICAAPFDNGNRMVYGTDNGVYLADLRDKNKVPVKVISVPSVTQLDVLEEQGILIVLADKAVQTFFVDHLDPGDAVGAAKRARKISASATFFKTGQCLGRTLVCVVKSGNVSSTIKTLEPVDQVRGKKTPGIRKFLQGSNESLRVFKEFYIPTESSSVHFLKSKLCVGCTKGFEIVDLETLDTQGLLDPADSSLDFVQKRENAKPIAIYRIDGEFLLCYDEFAFYVNKNGWRAKSNWIIQWEGFPTSFALHYPYVLAFEPTFIEVRHVDSGALMQIIPGNNIRCLYADSPPSSSAASASSAASSYYAQQQYHSQSPHANSPSQRYPPTRSALVVSDGDHSYSLVYSGV